jgi:hypothetical protein
VSARARTAQRSPSSQPQALLRPDAFSAYSFSCSTPDGSCEQSYSADTPESAVETCAAYQAAQYPTGDFGIIPVGGSNYNCYTNVVPAYSESCTSSNAVAYSYTS